ncbi:energy transducer TonB [uncultured Pseudoxanthomonas sp.]|uniref:energy transducer TonB n=1 Tax=uncultured Pseudoxanthomonas sp. TaxID=281701 RepID=UPI002610E894|nr:energy transducer TonB [uncultured Pseudoxanthomonas sp.]
MVRALPHGSDTRIDIGRIAAIAAAIAVHAAALLMLLMPMAAPPITPTVKPKPVVRWIQKEEPVPVVVPIEEQQTTVKREEPRPVVPARTVTTDTTIVDTPAVVDPGIERTIDLPAIDSTASTGTSLGAGPLQSATLEYVRATSPRYPTNELRNGIQGTVILRVLVDIDGRPVDVSVETSSGNRNLDKEARQHVLKTWRFKPAMQNGQAVQAYGLVPIAFNLQ